MKVSTFENSWDKDPKLVECTWDFFTKTLGPHEYTYTEKKATPAFVPGEFLPGTTCASENVVRLWLFVADLDHLTAADAQEAVQRVQRAGLAAIVYTSWSHASDPWRLRIVLPLSRPVAVEDWPGFWAQMSAAFGGKCDPQCSDPSRIYYGPYAPAGTEAANFYIVLPGTVVNVNAVIGAARDAADPERALVLKLLGEAWPSEERHFAHLALSGGLLLSGVSDEDAVEILCRVAEAQEPGNEDRKKREDTVAGTRERIVKGERITGWTTLAKYVGADLAMRAKQALEAPPKLSRDQLERFAKTLKRKNDDRVSELGEALLQVCKGEGFGEAGNRGDLVLRIANRLGEHFIQYDAASIADLFVPSLQLIGLKTSTCPSADDIAFSVKRKQEELRTAAREQKKAADTEQAQRIRDAFKNGRSHPYTAAELDGFGPLITKRWIIQQDRAYYLFFNGNYQGPYTDIAVQNAAVRDLAPASSAGVSLLTLTQKGPAFKDTKMLVEQYGTVADTTILDLSAQTTTYRENERCVIEAPCPLRPIKPVFHEDVDRWLQILAGVHYENLKTWIAVVTRLDFICSALFLTGRKSVGKSLLALGLSRLWTLTGPTSLKAAFDTFNDALASCPLTFADEHLPKDFRGYTKNDELRVHIQALERLYKRKYLPNGKLVGATRTMIAAHDKSILKTAEPISNNEVAGIVERYFHIPTNPEAAAYLESVDTYGRGWVSQDKIAEHALWLRDNHKHQSQGRFYVRVIDEGLFRSLTTQSGVKGSVCQWLVSYLLNPTKFHDSAYSNLYVRVRDGELLVNARGLMACWDTYIGKNERCPPTGILARAVAELCTEKRVKCEDKQGLRTNYRVVEMKNLTSWVEDNDFAESEVLLAALGRNTTVA